MIRRIHLIESGGRGGVFNHSVEVAAGLQALGHDVVLHTAADHDAYPTEVRLCRCVTWHRKSSVRAVRQARTSASYVARTLPHLLRAIDREDVVHIQGLFALTPELVKVARMRNATVVCSPHNTFVRADAPGGGRALSSALQDSDRVLVYSDVDMERVRAKTPEVGRVPLVQWTPPVDPERVKAWRQKLNPDGAVLALLPGQVRKDKNPDVFVRAVAGLPGWRGAIVGDDLGPGPAVDALIRALSAPVATAYGYLDVDDFMALVAAADVVVAPYSIASQSGVLSVAAALGVPSAAAPIGGLAELATAVAEDLSPQAIGAAMLTAVNQGVAPAEPGAAAQRYVEEYLLARQRRRAKHGPSKGTGI